MNPINEFENERLIAIQEMAEDKALSKLSSDWMMASSKYKYGYNFRWLGRPIIQMPTDIVALQELIWEVKPDLIIETGIAHGGSIIFYASMLELLGGEGQVIGIDIDIRPHNRYEIEEHPMYKRISMLEGSSTDNKIVEQVKRVVDNKKKVMVFLDSFHSHEHVLKELEIYSEFITLDSYIVAFDTIVQFSPEELFIDRPWKVGNNPWTAVQEFIKSNDQFAIDRSIQEKVIFTSAPDGFLKRIK